MKTLDRPRYWVADLFSGAGGLSFGLGLTGRFSTAFGVDILEEVGQTFRHNHRAHSGKPSGFIAKDLWDLSESDIWELLKPHGLRRPGDLDVLAGGPPCEGFSQNRSIRTHKNGRIEIGGYDRWFADPRNKLFERFLEIADFLKPRVVVIENVPQILTHAEGAVKDEILKRLRKMGYTCPAPQVLHAERYGVPQLRRRAFFLAFREESGCPLTFPVATHEAIPEGDERLFSPKEGGGDPRLPGDLGYFVTVREAIGDLPEPAEENGESKGADSYPDVPLSMFRRLMRSRRGVPKNHVFRLPSETIRARLRKMRPGMRLDHLPEDLRTKSWYFNSYGRLDWDAPAKTITKSVNYLGSGCFGHPDPKREHGITMREAARLQSFPDDFEFISESGPIQAHMIGSAVPPLLAKSLGRQIFMHLDSIANHARRETASG